MDTRYTIPNYILASKSTRFLNFLIDIIFLRILRQLIYFISVFIPFNNDYKSLSNWFNSFDGYQNILFWTILMFFYYATFEILFARTLSKYFTKTIVVLEDGSKPKVIDILTRSALRIIPFEYFTFLQGRKLGMHDENSKTFVVKKDKLEHNISDFKGLLKIENLA